MAQGALDDAVGAVRVQPVRSLVKTSKEAGDSALAEAEATQELACGEMRRLAAGHDGPGAADGGVLDGEGRAIDRMEVDRGLVERDERLVHLLGVRVARLVGAVVVVYGDVQDADFLEVVPDDPEDDLLEDVIDGVLPGPRVGLQVQVDGQLLVVVQQLGVRQPLSTPVRGGGTHSDIGHIGGNNGTQHRDRQPHGAEDAPVAVMGGIDVSRNDPEDIGKEQREQVRRHATQPDRLQTGKCVEDQVVILEVGYNDGNGQREADEDDDGDIPGDGNEEHPVDAAAVTGAARRRLVIATVGLFGRLGGQEDNVLGLGGGFGL